MARAGCAEPEDRSMRTSILIGSYWWLGGGEDDGGGTAAQPPVASEFSESVVRTAAQPPAASEFTMAEFSESVELRFYRTAQGSQM